MPDPIFERYKEALRAGHVAALRGRPDDALLQYRAAAAIAPDRALPHVGMAEVLLRVGRPDEALAACTVALRLAPHDETVLELAARVHEAVGRGPDAAIHLDRVADLRERQGRAGDALGAATRAHAADPTDARRARVAALTAVVEAEHARLANPAWVPGPDQPTGAAGSADDVATVASPPDAPAAAMGTSARIPRQAAGGRQDAGEQVAATVAAPVPAASEPRGQPIDTPPEPVESVTGAEAAADGTIEPGAAVAAAVGDALPPEGEGGAMTRPVSTAAAQPATEAAAAAQPTAEAGGGVYAAGDGSAEAGDVVSRRPDIPQGGPSRASQGDAGALFIAAEERAAAGDTTDAAALYVEAAGAYLGMGAVDTAVDACLRALSGAPAATEVHLALARIDVATGHAARAAERLDLLGRLLALEGDEAGIARVSAFRGAEGDIRERDGSTPGASATHPQV